MQTKTERSWFLAIFGLPFFAVGIGFLFFSILPTLYDGWRMAAWPSASGTLTHARLVSSRSDNSTTYGVEAHYRYQVGGQDYENDRPAINSDKDNIGDFQQRLGRELERDLRSNRLITVYYNPADPSDSVLNRDIRWVLLGFKTIFVLVFGGVGLGLIIFALRGKRTNVSPETKERPWLQRPEWSSNHIRSNARGGMYFIWGFALLWNLISAPASLQAMDIWQKEGAVALLILLFPLIGILLLVWAVRRTLEWRRFGITPLSMNPFPGAIGGDVAGEISLNIPYQRELVCELTLSSIHSYVSGSGKNRSRKENVVWQDSGHARVQHGAKGMVLQFRFEVPEGLPESEEHDSSYHLWRLSVKAKLPGTDLERDFEIPVFATSEKSSRIKFRSVDERPVGVAAITAESLLPLERRGNRVELYYPMMRKPGRAIGGILFGSIFTGIGAFLWHQAVKEGAMLYFMGGIFGFVGGLICLWGLYDLLNALRVSLDGHTLSYVRTLLGIPVSRKSAGYGEIRAIQHKKGAVTTQNGKAHKVEYTVNAETSTGQIRLAEQLDSYSKAEMVSDYFRKLIRI